MYNLTTEKKVAQEGFEPTTFGLTCPLLYPLSHRGTDLPVDGSNKKLHVDTNTGVVKESACSARRSSSIVAPEKMAEDAIYSIPKGFGKSTIFQLFT